MLATGGYGQVFASTSNPPAVTGDGVAMALRAGLAVRDVEFVQFHPTVLWRGPDAVGQQALVSEAVRGEGAVLYDGAGRRVMAGVHPQEDLAPRDVVAAAISARMAEAPGGVDDHVFLDATHMGERFYERFPSITAACRDAGIDPARDRIPVAPAAHYACGGVPARLDGTTALAGLFAVGEVSCTGVHGANRLASNSLTESVVAGTRLGRDLAWELPERVEPAVDAAGRRRRADAPTGPRCGRRCRATSACGRDAGSLAAAADALAPWPRTAAPDVGAERSSWETTNLLTVAAAVVAARRPRDGEPRLPPPHRLPRAPRRVASPPRRRTSTTAAAMASDARARRRVTGRLIVACSRSTPSPTTPGGGCSTAGSTRTPSPRSCAWPSPRT